MFLESVQPLGEPLARFDLDVVNENFGVKKVYMQMDEEGAVQKIYTSEGDDSSLAWSVFLKESTGMKINVHINLGKIITLQLEPSDTIATAKAKIQKKENIPAEYQQLFFNGRPLEEDGRSLADYRIQQDSIINLTTRIAVFVRCSTGKLIMMEVEPTDTVSSLKASLKDRIGLTSDHLRLFVNGEQLDEEKRLADYNIQKNSTIVLQETFQIFVKTVTGKRVVLMVKFLDKVEDIKFMVEGRFGVPLERHSLSYGGRALKDGKTLKDYGIPQDATLFQSICHRPSSH